MKTEDRITYAQAVWASWQDKAKSKRDMSSAEYHIIGKWMDANIPLPVVLRGIHEFEGVPRRLEAVVASVERAYAYWFQKDASSIRALTSRHQFLRLVPCGPPSRSTTMWPPGCAQPSGRNAGR